MAHSQSSLCAEEAQLTKKPRTRKSHQKVRTGCITCKIRRKKCDETKPNCTRCTSTGRRCDGYEVSPPAAARDKQDPHHAFDGTETRRIHNNTSIEDDLVRSQSSAWQTIARCPATQLFVSEIDLQCFDHFRLVTAPQFGAYHDSTVWRNFVVRAAFLHPVILKSAAALGAVHRRYNLGISPEAFQYCAISNRLLDDAIKTLQEFQSKSIESSYTHEIAMMAKLLHGMYHVFQGDYDSAAKNMTQGLATLWSRPFTKMITRTVRQSSCAHPHLFDGLYKKLASYAGRIMTRGPKILVDHKTGQLPPIPYSFPSFEHALDLLYTQIDFLCHIPACIWHDTQQRQELQAIHVSYLLRWNAALAETTNLLGERTAKQIRACFLLRRIRTSIYLLLYLILFLRGDTERKLLDFDMLESDGTSSDGLQGFPFHGSNSEKGEHDTIYSKMRNSDEEETPMPASKVSQTSHSENKLSLDAEPMIHSQVLWQQINQDEDLLTNLSRIIMLVDSTYDEDFSFDRYPYTMSLNIDSGIGPPRSSIPRPDSSSKTRHLVRSLLQPSLREKVFDETQTPPIDPPSTSSSSISSHTASFPDTPASITSPPSSTCSTSLSSKSDNSNNNNVPSSGRLYHIAEQLCSIEEHAVFAAAKQSLIVPRGVQPRWLDVSCFLEERKMLIRYCCRDDEQGVTGPAGGIIWTQEWVKF